VGLGAGEVKAPFMKLAGFHGKAIGGDVNAGVAANADSPLA